MEGRTNGWKGWINLRMDGMMDGRKDESMNGWKVG